jgi:hypothetical protein
MPSIENKERSEVAVGAMHADRGHNRYLVYARLLLLLSADGEVVDTLLGCMLWLSTHDLPPEIRDRGPDQTG